jgi:hypothetical protein
MSPLRSSLGLLLLVIVACHRSPASLSEVRSLPWETQRRFVLLGRVARSLACLQDYDWKNPDETCRRAVMEGSERLSSTPTSLMKSLPPENFPRLTRFMEQLRELHELVDEVKDEVSTDQHTPDRLRIAGRPAQEAGELATNLSEQMEVSLSLDAAAWGSFESLSEPVVRAKRPREAVPTTITAVATAGSAAQTEKEDEAPAAPKPPGRVVSASALVAPLIASVRLFDEARHDPALLLEAAARSRLKLETLAEDITAWRAMAHAEPYRAEAIRYADQIDRLRGRLLRVATMYGGAARRVIATTADELVYSEPDARFEKLKDEVRLAELYKPADL